MISIEEIWWRKSEGYFKPDIGKTQEADKKKPRNQIGCTKAYIYIQKHVLFTFLSVLQNPT
ncbi:MAG: hypothetical protein GX136_05060 [Clostridiales bacterium]|jgi:hypothetical protein|nr:hypothetical protein [Clostridiales bacterium]